MSDVVNWKRLVLTLAASALAIFATGCSKECSVDSDCASKGSGLVCDSNNKCVAGGTDAGPGNDAGHNDAGHTDAGQTGDAGTDAGSGPTSLTLALIADAGYSSPMATAISSSGATVYFTAFDSNNAPNVFSVAGGTVTALTTAVGTPLVMPSGLALSADDSTLFIADLGTQGLAADGTTVNDQGAIWTLPSAGAASPARLSIPGLEQPVAVTIAADGTSLLVSGKDSTGVAGVFKVAAAGGVMTPLAQTGLTDPGEAGEIGGALWVADHRGASGYGSLLRYTGGTGTDLTPSALYYGFPAGLVGSIDGSTVYAAYLGGLLYTPSSGVGTGGTVTLSPSGTGVDFPSGLSRAKASNTFAFSDGEGTAGTIYTAK